MALNTALLVAATAPPATAAEWLDAAKAHPDDTGKIVWYDILDLGLEGRGWETVTTPYDRLPSKAKGVVPDPVWGLGRNSAGMCVRFRSDATAIRARWALRSGNLAMNHMPATGVSGLDLYVRTEDGRWRWLGVGRPAGKDNEAPLVGGIPPGEREYILYLPLYNGVTKVMLGIPSGNRIAPGAPPATQAPIVFYGTSITQGGCASRPGMVHTAIIGRHLDAAVINLGFSGNGRMEQELADLLAELEPSVYVLDCLPNMGADLVSARVEPFVRTLPSVHPHTPIVLVEDRNYSNAFLVIGSKRRNETNHKALRQAYENLLKAGTTGLHYVEGDQLLGDDGEGTVDGSHPTDLGFMRQAIAFEPILRPLLDADGK